MVEVAGFMGEAPGVRLLAGHVRAGWRLVAVGGLVGLLLALAGLRLVGAEFTATMVVGPTARTGVAAMGPRMPVQGADGAFGLAEPGAGDETLSDFTRALHLLGSIPVAERLMTDPLLVRRLFPERWDAAAGRWAPPSGPLAALKRLWLALAGRSEWVEPDAAIVAARLRRMLVVAPVGTSPMRRLSLRHADRAFALDLLGRLAAEADRHLRGEALRRSAAQIAYLDARLAGVSKVEQRKPLQDLRTEQERVALLLDVELPFAADPIELPSAARLPDWPDPLVVPAAALAGGLLAGVGAATLRSRRATRP